MGSPNTLGAFTSNCFAQRTGEWDSQEVVRIWQNILVDASTQSYPMAASKSLI